MSRVALKQNGRGGRRARETKVPAGTVLVTGFEPFGGGARNPSGEIAHALDGRVIAGRRVAGVVLPCVFGKATRELGRQISRHRPAIVVCLGLASGRAEVTPERVAINIEDARMPDNAGRQPVDRPVVRTGPAAYWSTLPIKAIVAGLRSAGVPAAVSQTAGTFVCNSVFYGLMHRLQRLPGVRGGFVHVPAMEESGGGAPALPLATLIDAVARVVEIAVKVRRDRRVAAGAEQ
ncbi:MAG: pyroglutamyl-peptidase I [Verrucomicrobia bacterium]|nr:pyroglutamyl-peptidase I [Verrucomicrobiota bacterium]